MSIGAEGGCIGLKPCHGSILMESFQKGLELIVGRVLLRYGELGSCLSGHFSGFQTLLAYSID